MQLRHYFAIARRFWPLLLLPLAVGALSLALALRAPQQYASSARLMVTQASQVRAEDSLPDFNVVSSWQSSSFILDDIPQVVSSFAFAQDVSALLSGQGYAIEPGAVQASLRGERFHRSVTLSAVAGDPQQAQLIASTAAEALRTNGLKYWGRASGSAAQLSVAVLDPAGPGAPLGSTRQMVQDVGLRVVLALAAAVGLAFLLHYLDDRLRTQHQAATWMGVEVLGAIPPEGSSRTPAAGRRKNKR